ncbi:MAG: DNA mismatch repair protein MutT [Epulopiscium sp. Nele67-Bin004]|nr:MAG: DNA mismatch repair protein MutT [Epulopiscium sp. Nele67-Bin004]
MYEAVYENKTGETKSWMLATRKSEEETNNRFFGKDEPHADAVLIIALHVETKSIACVKQFRIPINNYIYELPAGLIDPGENIYNSLKRELKEETGLDLIKLLPSFSCSNLYLSPGMTDESVALVICTCEGEISTQYLEPDEDIEPMLINKDDAKRILQSSEPKDIKLHLVLQEFVEGMYDEVL